MQMFNTIQVNSEKSVYISRNEISSSLSDLLLESCNNRD